MSQISCTRQSMAADIQLHALHHHNWFIFSAEFGHVLKWGEVMHEVRMFLTLITPITDKHVEALLYSMSICVLLFSIVCKGRALLGKPQPWSNLEHIHGLVSPTSLAANFSTTRDVVWSTLGCQILSI